MDTKHTRLGRTEAILLNDIAAEIHSLNHKWWVDPATGDPKARNVGEMLALCHSELSEALEYHRKGDGMDDKLTDRKGFEVELADCVIRILDLAFGLGYDIGGALVAKCEFNATRIDHTLEARLAPGGKAY